jgi:hypothetical protein
MKFLVTKFLQPPVPSSLIGLNIPLKIYTQTPSIYSSLNVRDKVSPLYKRKVKIIIACILIPAFLNRRLEDKRCLTEW